MVNSSSDLSKGITVVDAQSGLTSVELYTQASRITAQLARGLVRVSDVFNQIDRPFLTFEKASIAALTGDKPSGEVAEVQVNKQAVVIVCPRESSTPQSPASMPRPRMHIDKQRYPVVVEAPPFSITGYIHLVRETRVRDALSVLPAQFIPLTDVTLTISGASRAQMKAEAVIINKSFIHIMYTTSAPAVTVQPSKLLIRRVQ